VAEDVVAVCSMLLLIITYHDALDSSSYTLAHECCYSTDLILLQPLTPLGLFFNPQWGREATIQVNSSMLSPNNVLNEGWTMLNKVLQLKN
jgi:hypothetical protein